jgi:glycosyltransferase involved in cell wall biosynthesis
MKMIAFIVQHPKGISPGQRFRFEIWEPILNDAGFEICTYSFFDYNTSKVLYQNGFLLKKTFGLLRGFYRRVILMFIIGKFDFIFLQREFTPLGPPFFELLITRIYKLKIIYDFDDAIWITQKSIPTNIFSKFKCEWKIKYLCKWAHKISCGNNYLGEFAKTYNRNVIVMPTCVDTTNTHNIGKSNYGSDFPIVGWTGSHSTLPYLDLILPTIKRLQSDYKFGFIIICDRDPLPDIKNYQFIKWNSTTEISDLLKIDIGVMPLTKDEWSKGKCGLKIIQYFALGIPAIASSIGVNSEIIDNEINGFLCTTEAEWEKAFISLLTSSSLREKMGKSGREKVEQFYSIKSQKSKFISLFDS